MTRYKNEETISLLVVALRAPLDDPQGSLHLGTSGQITQAESRLGVGQSAQAQRMRVWVPLGARGVHLCDCVEKASVFIVIEMTSSQ